jgi:hypothetical protein
VSDHIHKTIADFRAKLGRAENEVIRLKKTINDLCDMVGLPLAFGAAELDPSGSSGGVSFSADAFYGKPLATCIKMILDRRKAADLGAATLDEIFQQLSTHGYHFEGKEENRKASLRMAIRKNSEFHRLPNGTYGMRDWYDRIKGKTNGEEAATEDEADADADADAKTDEKK